MKRQNVRVQARWRELDDEHIIDVDGNHYIFKNFSQKGQKVASIDIFERVVNNRIEHLLIDSETNELNWRPQ